MPRKAEELKKLSKEERDRYRESLGIVLGVMNEIGPRYEEEFMAAGEAFNALKDELEDYFEAGDEDLANVGIDDKAIQDAADAKLDQVFLKSNPGAEGDRTIFDSYLDGFRDEAYRNQLPGVMRAFSDVNEFLGLGWDMEKLSEKAQVIPNDGLVELQDNGFELNLAYARAEFDDLKYRLNEPFTMSGLYERMEPKLQTDDQKNAVRQMMNAFAAGPEEMLTGYQASLLKRCGAFARGEMSAQALFHDLYRMNIDLSSKYGDKIDWSARGDGTDCFKSSGEYCKAALQALDLSEMKNEAAGMKDGLLETLKPDSTFVLNSPELDADRFPKENFTNAELVGWVEEKLETPEQKNTFRAVLNGTTTGEIDYYQKDLMTTHIGLLLDGFETAERFTAKMSEVAETQKKNYPDAHYNYADKAKQYASGDIVKDRNATAEFNKKLADRGFRPIDEIIKEINADVLAKKAEKEANKAKQKTAGTHVRKKSNISYHVIDEDTLKYYRTLTAEADYAKSMFRNSDEYKEVMHKLAACRSLAEACYANMRRGTEIEYKKLDPEAQKYFRADIYQSGFARLRPELVQEAYVNAHNDLIKAADAYRKYKFKQRYAGTEKVAGKKPLNDDDIRKLEVIDQIRNNRLKGRDHPSMRI